MRSNNDKIRQVNWPVTLHLLLPEINSQNEKMRNRRKLWNKKGDKLNISLLQNTHNVLYRSHQKWVDMGWTDEAVAKAGDY